MELWILATLAAALFQTVRFALQKRLKLVGLSTAGATWARFLWSAPFLTLAMVLSLAVLGLDFPALPWRFWAFALAGGIGQILATLSVVALFSLRHFAVGITLKKTEVLQTVLVGWVILGESVSPAGLLAMGLGLLALILLSGDAPLAAFPRNLWSRAMGLGVASGAFFAVAGVAYRGATLSIDHGSVAVRAAVALWLVTLIQTTLMAVWFGLRDREEAMRVLAAWRPGLLVGLFGLAGSFCWFVAFAEQTAAYVYALGQVELVLSVAGGIVLFGETPSAREMAGIVLLMVSLVALVLVA